jgi:hypothetical protein
VQCLELSVQNRKLNQPIRGIFMDVSLPPTHGFRQRIDPNRNIASFFNLTAGWTDPARDTALLARRLVMPAHTVKQDGMRLFHDTLA